MKSREKMLAIAVGAVLALFGLKWGYDFVADKFQSREAAITDLTSRKEKDEGTIRAGEVAERRFHAAAMGDEHSVLAGAQGNHRP